MLVAAAIMTVVRAHAATPTAWDVTLAVRVKPTNGTAVAVRVALPPNDAHQRVSEVTVTSRGLKAEVINDGAEPHVMLRGKLKSARRVAITFRIERLAAPEPLPAIVALDAPPDELLPFLTPSPLFQSRSILVRDFLETNVSPLLDAPGADLVRSVRQVTREKLAWSKDGKTLTLDVIRSGRGKRIGIERAFTTFLRCARVPARFVEGVDLKSKTAHKRAFWTEVWAQGA